MTEEHIKEHNAYVLCKSKDGKNMFQGLDKFHGFLDEQRQVVFLDYVTVEALRHIGYEIILEETKQ